MLVTSGLFIFLALLMSAEVYLGQTFVIGQIYGSNPLFIYLLSSVWAIGFSLPLIAQNGEAPLSMGQWIFDHVQPFTGPYMASFSFALLSTLVFYALSYFLYRKKVFIRLQQHWLYVTKVLHSTHYV